MGKYHSELLMLFNLAFLMKCKYNRNISSSVQKDEGGGNVTSNIFDPLCPTVNITN